MKMSEAILQELRFLLVSAAFGIFGGLAYDGLRIFRRLVRHGVWWVALEDLLFCMAASLAVFAMVFMENDGSVRFFSLCGLLLGGVLYYISVSRYLVSFAVWLIRFPFRFLASAVKKILAKIRKIR